MEPWSVILLVVFLFLSAFFSGAESAYLSINLLKFQTLAKESHGAKRVLALRERTDRLIIVMLIGTNLSNIAATAMVTAIVTDTFWDAGIGIATGLMTLLILIFGEILPKNLALTHSTKIAIVTGPIFKILMIALYPLVIFFEILSRFVVRVFGGNENERQYSEDDLKTLVEVWVSENQVEEEDRRRIEGILNFDDLQAGDVMTPRLKMYVIQKDRTLEEVYSELIASGHSRIPIIDEDKDHIVGVLYLRDFFEAYITKDKDTDVGSIVRPPLFIGEYETIGDVLEIFQREHRHMAIVQDEYGGTAGLVSMEDIIEEVTGDIFDETDKHHEARRIRKSSKDTLIVAGDVEIEKINELLDVQLDREDDFNTISGYLQSESETVIKEVGHREIIGDLEFEVLEMQRSQPSRIKVRKLPSDTL